MKKIKNKGRVELAAYEGQTVGFISFLDNELSSIDWQLNKRVINNKLYICMLDVEISTLGCSENPISKQIGYVDHMFITYKMAKEFKGHTSVFGLAKVSKYYRANGSSSYELIQTEMSEDDSEEYSAAFWESRSLYGLREFDDNIAQSQWENYEYQKAQGLRTKRQVEIEDQLSSIDGIVDGDEKALWAELKANYPHSLLLTNKVPGEIVREIEREKDEARRKRDPEIDREIDRELEHLRRELHDLEG